MKNQKYRIYFYLMGLIVIVGCHTKHATTQQKQATVPASQSINAKWVLEKLNGYPLEKDNFDSEKPRLEIQTQNRMYFGYTGCNQMNGQIILTDTNIEFKPGPMTRKACLDGGNIESDFLAALMSSKYYTLEHGKLELKNMDGKVVCQFHKVN